MIHPLLRKGIPICFFLLIQLAGRAQDCLSAGSDASTSVCTSAPTFPLIDALGGDPDPGGSWQGPGGTPHGPDLDPGTDAPGTYTYTHAAVDECPASSATVTVTMVSPPNAGTSASTTVCSDQAAFNMRLQLGGSPQSGGTWTGPGGAAHVSTFDPSSDVSGAYTYTVSGQGVCADAVATLTVTNVTAPDAGSNGTLILCGTDAPVPLIDHLGGTPDAGGDWTGPDGAHSGVIDPSSDPGGVYTYTVSGSGPCGDASATVTVTVNEQPDAGSNGSITVCSNGTPFSLFAQLNGSPDPGGTWTGPGGGSVSGTYTPGTSAPGTYTYTILGQPPCVASSATVAVTQVTAPNAGQNANFTICSDQAPVPLIGLLNGSPDAGGSWTGPNGPHGANFDPGVHPAGIYTYTVAGTAPCANASATVNITVRTAPDAGTSSSATVCSTDGNIALIDLLGGTPQSGGSWTGPGGGAHSGTFVPGTSAPGAYTYTVVGQAPCTPATATVTMTVSTAPVAGTGASMVRCSNDGPFSLLSQLGGSPDSGGSWTGPNGTHSGTFTPGTDPAGTYTYTVEGDTPCADATASLNISIVPAPNAGVDNDTLVCSSGGQFQLIDVLGGSPSQTGTWSGPGGSPSNGTFVPGTSVPGTYTYTVAGQAPCADAQATVTVSVQAMPDPGTNGGISVCSNDPSVALFTLLGGTPQAGGTWTAPGGGAHNGTYLPATQNGGTYTYTVAGTTPCPSASASVQVVRVIAPRAGTDGNITVCSTNGPFQLINSLGGDPNGGGSWFDPSDQPVSGTFTPGTSPPGVFTYVVTGTGPCENDTAYVTVNVVQAPVAGTNANIAVCSSDAAFPLVGALGGTPDAGGSWTSPSGTAHNGTFTPGTSAAGGYTYTVSGTTPCLNASAVVVVDQQTQPSAGTSGSFTRCSTDAPVDLMTMLGGSPDAGGVWSGPGPLTGSIFDPANSTPGTYTYTVAGTSPCENATAQVTAVVNNAPDAGTGGTITVCEDANDIDLFTGITGDHDLNGSWNDDDGTNQLSANLFSPTGLALGTYSFTYTVPGIGQCASDQTTVDVTIVGGLNAGSNGLMNVCRTNTQVDLFSGLNGSPQPGGTWLDLDNTGAQTGQFFNASFVAAGTYHFQYQLTGTVACASASATVTVNVTQAPNAGTNGQAVLCGNGASVNLFNYLGGSPATGGTWTKDGNTVSSTYNPSIHQPGTFIYTVPGSGPCANAQSSVVVSEVAPPNAGVGGTTTVCCSDNAFNMTALLTGSPGTGTWSFNGSAHSAIFQPCLDQPGVYTYTVPGQAPCNSATASLTINVVQPPEAGSNSSLQICSDDNAFLLLPLMSGADFGGTWTDPSGDGHPASLQFVPGTSQPGAYTYTVNGTAPCAADVATLNIFEDEAANAGDDVSVGLCSNGATVDLFTLLPGDPDPTGQWYDPDMQPFSGSFDPGVSEPGVYTYVVEGAPSCENDSATVTVSVTNAPNAGQSAVRVFCSNSQAFSMVQQLNGTPQLNGTWHGPLPSTATIDGIFFPGGSTPSTPGTYVYTVPGSGGCGPATSTLEVLVNPAPFAGVNADTAICNTSGNLSLFPLLGPAAQAGGTWSGGTTGTFDPAAHTPGSYTFTYTVNGLSPCAPHSAQVNVTLSAAPNAGFNGLAIICDDDLPINLLTLLNGDPQGNGSWVGPNGPHTGVFLPGQDESGVHTYTVNGSAACSSASAQVTIIQNEQPDAGQAGVVQICSDQAPFQLFQHLTGTPDIGGSWLDPSMAPFSGTFIPGSSTPGIYTYYFTGLEPCTNDSATVTVLQSIAPDAGCNTAIQICSNSPVIQLIDLLGCSPQPNGYWTFGSGGADHGPLFDPAVDVSGTYYYHVDGAPPCDDAIAQVQITKITAPNAGNSGSIAACVDDPSIPLSTGLGGSPSTGGTWTALAAVGSLTNGVFNATGVAPGSYQFRYVVNGLGPCENDTSFVTVQISEALDAGEDAAVEICQSQLLDLFTALNGTPQAGGSWQDIDGSGALIGNVFNASEVAAGTVWRFDHILGPSALCEGDTARVTVTVQEGPEAGCNGGQITVCSSSTPVQLANSLGCSPDAGGSWHGPEGPHSGEFDPAGDAPGTYWYVLPAVGTCPGDSSSVPVAVVQAPNAGEDAQLSICSTDASISLTDLLGPDAQTGGSWTYITGGNTSHNGIYNPAVDQPGTYRYRVTAQLPCASVDAFVEVTEPQAPDAGCNGSVNLCSSSAPINLISQLGCSPGSGGTWYDPEMDEHGPLFDPATDQPGAYTYVITGTDPCADDTATLVVAVTYAQDPGTSTTVNACVAQTAIDLLEALGAQADPNGTWTDINTSGALSGNTFDPSEAGIGIWNFEYSFPSNGPCPAVSSTVTVEVGSGADAGADSTLVVCGHDSSFDLFSALAGNPDPGGVWEDLTGSGALLPNGVLNVQLLAPGTTAQFGYVIEDPGCGDVSAVVTVTASEYGDPGVSGALAICETSAPADLFDHLGGTPEEGGTWLDPQGGVHSGVFDPSADVPGAYQYTMEPTAFCPALTAQVVVDLNEPAFAGNDGTLIACDTALALPLITGLEGSPQPGGEWLAISDVGGAMNEGSLNTAILDPGLYQFQYTVISEGCGSDTALLNVQVIEGVAVSGTETTCDPAQRTYTVTFAITQGDPSTYVVTGVDGGISAQPPYIFTSAPIPTSQGFDIMVTDGSGCQNIRLTGSSPCDFDDDIFIPGSFSPNDDGVNDLFIIPGIEGFPANQITIFNRWGNKVFEASGYDNSSVVWDGTSNAALIQGKAPGGTYFYVIELGDGGEAYTGYIYLNR